MAQYTEQGMAPGPAGWPGCSRRQLPPSARGRAGPSSPHCLAKNRCGQWVQLQQHTHGSGEAVWSGMAEALSLLVVLGGSPERLGWRRVRMRRHAVRAPQRFARMASSL